MKLLATVVAAFSLLTAAGAHATEDFCAVVLKPPAEVARDRSYDPDAWLALRDGPGTKFTVVGKLREGDLLQADTARCKETVCDDKAEWTHVVGIPRYDGTNPSRYSQGWVRSKHIQTFVCEADQGERATPGLPNLKPKDLATISRSATRVELPPYVLGSWCFGWAPPRNALWRARNFDDCGNRGGIRFSNSNRSFEQGRFDWRASCEITSIKLIATKYRVSSYCHANGPMFVGDPVEGPKVFDVWRSKGSLYLEDASDEAAK
jgi:hypothetical protein